MLLGALVDAGASLAVAAAAVETLGRGDVRLAWVRVERQELGAIRIRLRAPSGTPMVGSWEQVRRLVEHAAVPDDVRDLAVATMTTLVAAVADELGRDPDDLELPQVTMLDHVAATLAVASAISQLGIQATHVHGALAIGHGTWTPLLGPASALPDVVVENLTIGLETTPGPRPDVAWTTRLGAAWLTTLGASTVSDTDEARGPATSIGFGAAAHEDDHDGILRATLHRLDRTSPHDRDTAVPMHAR